MNSLQFLADGSGYISQANTKGIGNQSSIKFSASRIAQFGNSIRERLSGRYSLADDVVTKISFPKR